MGILVTWPVASLGDVIDRSGQRGSFRVARLSDVIAPRAGVAGLLKVAVCIAAASRQRGQEATRQSCSQRNRFHCPATIELVCGRYEPDLTNPLLANGHFATDT